MKEIEKIIIDNAPALKVQNLSFQCDAITLLRAIAQRESSYGVNNHPRFEASYYIGGRTYNRSPLVRDLVDKYGKDASCSYSSWQIMYPVAVELGFVGSPTDLGNDEVAIKWIVTYINKRIIRLNPTKLEDIFDAYNSGNFKDSIIPEAYITKGVRDYNNFLENPIEIIPQIKKVSFSSLEPLLKDFEEKLISLSIAFQAFKTEVYDLERTE